MANRDPLVGYHFRLEVGGTLIGSFRDLSVAASVGRHKITENLSAIPKDRGIARPAFRMMARPAEAPAAPDTPVVRKIPGRLKWADITVRSVARPGAASQPPAVQFKWGDTRLKSTTRAPIDQLQQKVRGATGGATRSDDLWDWRKVIETGNKLNQSAMKWQPVTLEIQGFVASGTAVAASDDDQSGRITLVNDAGTPVARWNFENGWPVKVTGPPSATSAGTSFTLQVDGLRKA